MPFFSRVKCSCIASSEYSSARFFNLLVIFSSSCDSQWTMCCQRLHGTGGKHSQFWCLIIFPLTPRKMGGVQGILRFLPLVGNLRAQTLNKAYIKGVNIMGVQYCIGLWSFARVKISGVKKFKSLMLAQMYITIMIFISIAFTFIEP